MLAAALLAGCGPTSGEAPGRPPGPAPYASWGERIYFTARGTDGRPIRFDGGSIAARIRPAGCAGCHGADRRGGRRMWPRWWRIAPDITPPALFGVPAPGGEPAPRPPYDPESLRRAVRDGVGPSGRPLDPAMPRWAMSDRDLSELLYFLTR